MEDPVESWRKSESPGFAMRSNGDAAHEFCGAECWRGLQGPISQPAQCDLPMAIRERVVATSTLERYKLAVVVSRNDEQSGPVLELEARNRVEPSHLPSGALSGDLNLNSSHVRTGISGASFSTNYTSSPSTEASAGPAQPSTESNRSIGIRSTECTRSLKSTESSSAKQIARCPQIEYDGDAQKLISPLYFAQHSLVNSTDILQGVFPSKARRAVEQDTKEGPRSNRILDDLVVEGIDASDMKWTKVGMDDVTLCHPSLHGFELPPAFPPRQRGFDLGELEGAMSAAFGWD